MARNSSSKKKPHLTAIAFAMSIALTGAGIVHAAERSDADNTRINDRDAAQQRPTPLDQSNTSTDTAIVAKIRSAITDDKTLSVNAHNVKVIVRNGAVTLRGPVENAEEKARIETIVQKVAGVTSIQSDIDVKH